MDVENETRRDLGKNVHTETPLRLSLISAPRKQKSVSEIVTELAELADLERSAKMCNTKINLVIDIATPICGKISLNHLQELMSGFRTIALCS